MDRCQAASQTLIRGLDILEAVAGGVNRLPELAEHAGLSLSTAYRLAIALAARDYLRAVPRSGFTLGPKLMELGQIARRERDLVRLARPFVEQLSNETSDTVLLGVVEGNRVLHIDMASGRRRINVSARIGECLPLTSSGLGKALLLDGEEERWRQIYRAEPEADPTKLDEWLGQMRALAVAGYSFDLVEDEDRIRCVAAPIRDASNLVVGAIGVFGVSEHMDDARMAAVSATVCTTAERISALLGWIRKSGNDGRR